MQIAAAIGQTTGAGAGMPAMTIGGVDAATNASAPMRVFTRQVVGRFDGYGSLATAISAARTLSRGTDRPALVVDRRDDGIYEIRDTVWQYLPGAIAGPGDRAPARHFHFEDGSFSQYTAWDAGRRVQVVVTGDIRSVDDEVRWLVDGARLFEVAPPA